MRAPIRTLAERLTRRLVFKRRLPPPFAAARIYVTPAARLGYAFKPLLAAEPALFHCVDMLVRPGHVVWDIGANIGLFSVAAAVRAGTHGRVVAFEPDLRLAGLLRASAAIQKSSLAPIETVPVAVAKDVAIRSFAIAARARAANALAEYGGSQMGGVVQHQFVPAFNLDWLLAQLPPPDVLKIDVEGAELEVLQGQKRMLEEVRPIIICEVGSQATGDVTALLRGLRYGLYDGDKPLRPPCPVAHATWNTVAIPEEKTSALAP